MPNGPLKTALRKVAHGERITTDERVLIAEYLVKVEDDPGRYASERVAATLLLAALDRRETHV